MMLSILIPIYNENCVNLVSDLLIQAKALACPYEILVFDDFSPIQYKENEIINQWENTTFKTLSENLGRATAVRCVHPAGGKPGGLAAYGPLPLRGAEASAAGR